MYVSNLSLRDFRNYQRLDLQLAPGTTLLYGPNAAGKTSVLDAVCFALYGQVPGTRRAGSRLRSDHADDWPTIVHELEHCKQFWRGGALVQALSYPDRRVRFEAAFFALAVFPLVLHRWLWRRELGFGAAAAAAALLFAFPAFWIADTYLWYGSLESLGLTSKQYAATFGSSRAQALYLSPVGRNLALEVLWNPLALWESGAILVYLETIPAARKFMSASRSAARACGRSGMIAHGLPDPQPLGRGLGLHARAQGFLDHGHANVGQRLDDLLGSDATAPRQLLGQRGEPGDVGEDQGSVDHSPQAKSTPT